MTIMQRLGKQVLGLLGGLLLMLPAMATESVTYYHNDVAGTPMLATDAAGNLLWKETYLPYGKKQTNEPASVENRIGYAGKPYDTATGLSYMGARYYDPLTGRFTGVDPKGFDQANLQSFNRYAYANNNPYKFVDPDGRETQVIITKDYLVDFTAFGNRIKLGEYGSHAAVRVDNPSGSPVLYDPAGSYNPRDENGPVRGSGDILEGKHANLESYVKYQNSLGSDVEISRFATTPSQEREIASRAEAQGGSAPFGCAASTSSAISGIGPFKDIKQTRRPGGLSNQMGSVSPPPKTELREAQ